MAQLSATRCSCIAILWVSLVSFAAVTLCVRFQRVFIFVIVYFVIDSVRKLLDTPSYICYDTVSYCKALWAHYSTPKLHYRYLNINIFNQNSFRIGLVTIIYGAGVAQWHSAGLRDGWSRVPVPGGAGNISLHHRVQTGSGAHPASNPSGTRSSYPGGKVAGAWSKNAWSYTSTPQYTSWRGAQLKA
jgi:hypothetical protein